MSFPINDGSRPSKLELGRRLSGELPMQNTPEEAAFSEQVARPGLAPFDWEILSKAAARVPEEDPLVALPKTAELPDTREAALAESWWQKLRLAWLVPVLVAAMALFFVLPQGTGPGIKGDNVDIDFMLQRDGEMMPGTDAELFQAGDRLQFSYRAPGHSDLVLVGVDGTGALNVYYPQTGELPHPIVPGERHFLEGSIELDAAPGPEVFVAVFVSGSVQEARELVRDTYEQGGHAALEGMVDMPGIDVVRIDKEEAR